jgi:hypothetical protein
MNLITDFGFDKLVFLLHDNIHLYTLFLLQLAQLNKKGYKGKT